MQAFRVLILVLSLTFLLVKIDFILVNVSLDKAILFNFFSHGAPGVIVKPEYLEVPTCFILSPFQRMSHTVMSDCF